MKYLVLAPFIFFSFSALAAQCVVVSGSQKDGERSAFKNRKILDPATSSVGGQKCTVVGGLKALKQLVASGKIKAGSDLLIVIGAHGSVDAKGVTRFDFNADEPSADEMYAYLRTLATTHQVGAVFEACYSGDVMSKLIKEENDKLAGKLCIVTSSSKGRSSYTNEDDLLSLLGKINKPNSGVNLESIFKETPTGMISSAAWEQTGVAKYMRNKSLENNLSLGFEAMGEMDKITRAPGAVCDSPGEANSALCMSSAISDKTYKDLMHVVNIEIPIQDVKGLVNGYTITAGLDGISKSTQECYATLAKTFAPKNNPTLSFTWKDLEKMILDVKKNPKLMAACEKAHKESGDKGEIDSILAGDMYKGLKTFRESRDRLKKLYSQTDWNSFNLNAFAQKSAGDKRVCSLDSKKEIIMSLFGDGFFKEEYYTDSNYQSSPGDLNIIHQVNTQHMMKSFQEASISKADMPNPIDAKRRKACRDFKL